MKLQDRKRTGLFPEHSAGIAPLVYEARATIPVVEALQAAGAKVEPLPGGEHQIYRITLGKTMPKGIVAKSVPHSGHWSYGLRMDNEPEYPTEHPDMWLQVDFTPCPKCGAPVVWYEAGYVPGYRVCNQTPSLTSSVILRVPPGSPARSQDTQAPAGRPISSSPSRWRRTWTP